MKLYHLNFNATHGEKARGGPYKDTQCCFCTNSGSNKQQNDSCMVTYIPSRKSSKWDKQDILGMTGEVGTNL